jgi:hypothetical protein
MLRLLIIRQYLLPNVSEEFLALVVSEVALCFYELVARKFAAECICSIEAPRWDSRADWDFC